VSALARHAALLRFAADNVVGRARAYLFACAGLVAGLALLLSGVAVGEGLRSVALDAVDAGADLYVTWDRFGREAPLARGQLDALRGIEGVTAVTPRILGRTRLDERVVVVIGVPLERLQEEDVPVLGRVPAAPNEVLLGAELARALDLRPGATIALEGDTLRLFEVSGIAQRRAALWSTNAVVLSLDEAALLFGEGEHVTDACVDVRPGYEGLVADAIGRLDRRFRVQTRSLVRAYVQRGISYRTGVFALLAAVALALSIPALVVTTWLGLAPRRREIALLMTDGWSVADVLELVALEGVLVALLSALAANALAVAWVGVLDAPGVAPFFVPGLGAFPASALHAEFLPLAPVLALAFSLTVVLVGSLPAAWRAASVRPAEVLG
jgi:ABC-type lipoprotein release transport system permease subunit